MPSYLMRFTSVLLLAAVILASPRSGPARSSGAEVADETAPTSAALPSPAIGSALGTPGLEGLLPQTGGVTLEILGSGGFGRLPAGSGVLRLDRLSLAPGASTDQVWIGGPHLLFVETGRVAISGVPGLAGLYGRGETVPLPAGAAYALDNDATEPGSLLRLGLADEAGATPPALAP